MGAYVLPVIAIAVLLAMILRDAERYKRNHPQREFEGVSPFNDESHGH